MAKRKIQVETDNSDWQAPKKKHRKPRKPMSEEQRTAAAERLVKVREARVEKDPTYGKAGIHETLHNLPDDHHLHPDKIKQWIKTQKDLLKTENSNVRAKIKGAIARAAIHEGYIKHMLKYLQHGDWVDNFYGEYQDKTVGRRCTAQAYYWYGPKKGDPKFDVGVYYPLLGCVYTQEMFDEERTVEEEREAKVNGKKSRKRTPRK